MYEVRVSELEQRIIELEGMIKTGPESGELLVQIREAEALIFSLREEINKLTVIIREKEMIIQQLETQNVNGEQLGIQLREAENHIFNLEKEIERLSVLETRIKEL